MRCYDATTSTRVKGAKGLYKNAVKPAGARNKKIFLERKNYYFDHARTSTAVAYFEIHRGRC